MGEAGREREPGVEGVNGVVGRKVELLRHSVMHTLVSCVYTWISAGMLSTFLRTVLFAYANSYC